jgi:hypothetical protein
VGGAVGEAVGSLVGGAVGVLLGANDGTPVVVGGFVVGTSAARVQHALMEWRYSVRPAVVVTDLGKGRVQARVRGRYRVLQG